MWAVSILFSVVSMSEAQTTEVRFVKIPYAIDFTWVYESIGTARPLEIIKLPLVIDRAKPGGLLAQTNPNISTWLVGLELGILRFVLIFVSEIKSKLKKQL